MNSKTEIIEEKFLEIFDKYAKENKLNGLQKIKGVIIES